MHSLFSRGRADINIRLDLKYLANLIDKDSVVRLAGAMASTTIYVISEISIKTERSIDQIVHPINNQTEELIVDGVQTTQLISGFSEIQRHLGEIQKEITSIRETVRRLRFWLKILMISLWGLTASIIANIIFKLFAT